MRQQGIDMAAVIAKVVAKLRPSHEKEQKITAHFHEVTSYNDLLPGTNLTTVPPTEIDDAIRAVRLDRSSAGRRFYFENEPEMRQELVWLVDDANQKTAIAVEAHERIRAFQRQQETLAKICSVPGPERVDDSGMQDYLRAGWYARVMKRLQPPQPPKPGALRRLFNLASIS